MPLTGAPQTMELPQPTPSNTHLEKSQFPL